MVAIDMANVSLTLARAASAVFFVYLTGGAIFAPFLLLGGGLTRLDPAAGSGTRPFRWLILPGTLILWPWLLLLWRRSRAGEAK